MTPFEVLNLPETASAAEVKARWVELAKANHPDVGGLAEDFRRYHAAYVAALAMASQPKACSRCGGAKSVVVIQAWFTTLITCPACSGSGLAS